MTNALRKRTLAPAGSAPARGPYSPALQAGPFVFFSGQIGLDPETGMLVEGGTQAEVRQTFENIRALLTGVGRTIDDIAKVSVFLADIQDWPAMNQVYANFFAGTVLPARTALAVAGLPLGARVEIEVTLVTPDS